MAQELEGWEIIRRLGVGAQGEIHLVLTVAGTWKFSSVPVGDTASANKAPVQTPTATPCASPAGDAGQRDPQVPYATGGTDRA
jgi:hypothetical protein